MMLKRSSDIFVLVFGDWTKRFFYRDRTGTEWVTWEEERRPCDGQDVERVWQLAIECREDGCPR
jgi:hypothetical protein